MSCRSVLRELVHELRALVRVLAPIPERLDQLMSTVSDLTAAVSQAAADESAEAAVIGQLAVAVEALVAALQSAGQVIPPDAQAAIDAAVSGLADVHTSTGVDTSALSDLTTEADGAVPPAVG